MSVAPKRKGYDREDDEGIQNFIQDQADRRVRKVFFVVILLNNKG